MSNWTTSCKGIGKEIFLFIWSNEKIITVWSRIFIYMVHLLLLSKKMTFTFLQAFAVSTENVDEHLFRICLSA